MLSENKDLFYHLVIMFQAAAYQQMGKLKNPVTDNIERDLSQAQYSIDMLSMIEEKTKQNLTEKEKKFLESVLTELKMNYVDEVKKESDSKTKEAEEKS